MSEKEQFSRSTTQGFGESFEEMVSDMHPHFHFPPSVRISRMQPLGMQPPPLPPLPARTTISSPEEDNESDDEGALISPENREGEKKRVGFIWKEVPYKNSVAVTQFNFSVLFLKVFH